MRVILEAIAQIVHEADRQLCKVYGVRDIDSWDMLSNERKKERIAIVQMIRLGSTLPVLSNNTELDECRNKLIKSIVLALLDEDVEEKTVEDAEEKTIEDVEEKIIATAELTDGSTITMSEAGKVSKKGAKTNGGV